MFASWQAPSATTSSSLAPPFVVQSLLEKSFIVPVQVAVTLQPQLEQVRDTPVPTRCWCVNGAPGHVCAPAWTMHTP